MWIRGIEDHENGEQAKKKIAFMTIFAPAMNNLIRVKITDLFFISNALLLLFMSCVCSYSARL